MLRKLTIGVYVPLIAPWRPCCSQAVISLTSRHSPRSTSPLHKPNFHLQRCIQMSTDRGWIRRRFQGGVISEKFKRGVSEFLEFAYSHHECVVGVKIKCSYTNCQLTQVHPRLTIKMHLYKTGFIPSYSVWDQHGESENSSVTPGDVAEPTGPSHPMREMVMDAGGFQFEFARGNVDEGELPNQNAQKFYDLQKAADEPLWDGCITETKLSMMTKLMSIKCRHGLSEVGAAEVLQAYKSGLPESEKLPNNWYGVKKEMKKLGLEYQKIHSCINDCVLYYKERCNLTECPTCKHPRYRNEGVVYGL